MKPLSPRADALIAALDRPPSMAKRVFGGTADTLAILEQLEGCDEPAVRVPPDANRRTHERKKKNSK